MFLFYWLESKKKKTNPNFIDLLGGRFGSLFVIERAPNYKSGAARWKCRCDCGKEVIVASNNLRLGFQKGCGGAHPKKDTLIGLKFGKLTVIELVGVKRKAQFVKAICDCGNEWVGAAYSLKKLNTQSCGCIPKTKRRTDREQVAFNRVRKSYKSRARKRNLNWSLPESFFFSLIKQNCYYCGKKPSSLMRTKADAKAYYNGVDRKNNKKGYVRNNVVACCKTCNLAKRELSVKAFLEHIKQIYEYSLK